MRSVLEENIKKFLIHKIQTDLRHHREVTVSDCVLFACKNQVPLLEEVTRYFFKLPDLIDDGKESSVGFNKTTIISREILSSCIHGINAVLMKINDIARGYCLIKSLNLCVNDCMIFMLFPSLPLHKITSF